jgi:hypothetical protein
LNEARRHIQIGSFPFRMQFRHKDGPFKKTGGKPSIQT